MSSTSLAGSFSPARPRAPHGLLAAAFIAILAAGVRLPFAYAGLGMDEGGYAYVARQWARGAPLYSDEAWIDRPQGLLLLYRLALAVQDTPVAVRTAAVLVGVVGAVAVFVALRELFGPHAALAGGAAYAVVSAAPPLEGFTLNGEVPATAAASVAVAAGLVATRRGSLAAFAAAGAAAGVALTMKQSGVEGVVALAAICLVRRPPTCALAVLAAGVAAAPGASVLHGVVTGPGEYVEAVVGYRAAASSGLGASLDARWTALADSWAIVGGLVGPVLVVAAAGGAAVALRGSALQRATVGGWAAGAAVGFNLGALYWSHYYLQLLPALVAAAAGLGLVAAARGGAVAAAAAVIAVPVAADGGRIITGTRVEQLRDIPYFRRSTADAAVARILRSCTQPDEPVLALPASASLHYLADRRPVSPQMWGHGLQEAGGWAGLERAVRGPAPPAVIVRYPAGSWSRATERVLHAGRGRYVHVATVRGSEIHARVQHAPRCRAAADRLFPSPATRSPWSA